MTRKLVVGEGGRLADRQVGKHGGRVLSPPRVPYISQGIRFPRYSQKCRGFQPSIFEQQGGENWNFMWGRSGSTSAPQNRRQGKWADPTPQRRGDCWSTSMFQAAHDNSRSVPCLP